MPKFNVELRWTTTEVAHADVEVEANSSDEAMEKAVDMQSDVCWGKSEIVDGEVDAVNCVQVQE